MSTWSLNLVLPEIRHGRTEVVKLIQPFLGEGRRGRLRYDPANLLILQDNNRNMKRNHGVVGAVR